MNTIEALIASGAMALAPYTNTWTLPLNAVPYVEFAPGPGFRVEGDKLVFQNQLPGTPVEGSKLTTETKKLEPCFAATIPACPGHWVTNRTEWVFRSGNWVVEAPEGPTVVTNNIIFLPGTNRWVDFVGTATNAVTTNQIESIYFISSATNVWSPLPKPARLEIESLEKQVEFWKAKALEAVR